MKFATVTVCPSGYRHAGAFAEVSDAFHNALLSLGHESIQLTNQGITDARNIFLGAHLLGRAETLPENSILVNLEQLENNSFLPPHYLDWLMRYTVWDYSAANVHFLRSRGARNVVCVPLGYVPQLSRISQSDREIDVLFYGSRNARRMAVLDQLTRSGMRVESLFGVYGAERDASIARATIVLNMHFHENKTLEVVRITYLLANRVFVVSEPGSDAADAARFKGGLVFCRYEQLAETCISYLADAPSRQLIAARGFELIRKQDQAQFLAPAVAALR